MRLFRVSDQGERDRAGAHIDCRQAEREYLRSTATHRRCRPVRDIRSFELVAAKPPFARATP